MQAAQPWSEHVPWDAMPEACQVGLTFKGNGNESQQRRIERKRAQVASFAFILHQLLPDEQLKHPKYSYLSPQQTCSVASAQSQPGTSMCSKNESMGAGKPLQVVDFGSGSGSLLLPLAWLCPRLRFTAVDMKPAAIARLQQRAAEACLSNIKAQVCTIECYRCACHM